MPRNVSGLGQIIGPEKYPGKADQAERDRHLDQFVQLRKPVDPGPPHKTCPPWGCPYRTQQIKSVEGAPNDECPVGAVPKPAEQKNNEEV